MYHNNRVKRPTRTHRTVLIHDLSADGLSDEDFYDFPPPVVTKNNSNRLSPRNRANRRHYERSQSQDSSSYEYVDEGGAREPVKFSRKRPGSPLQTNNMFAKRWQAEPRIKMARLDISTPQGDIPAHPIFLDTPVQEKRYRRPDSLQHIDLPTSESQVQRTKAYATSNRALSPLVSKSSQHVTSSPLSRDFSSRFELEARTPYISKTERRIQQGSGHSVAGKEGEKYSEGLVKIPPAARRSRLYDGALGNGNNDIFPAKGLKVELPSGLNVPAYRYQEFHPTPRAMSVEPKSRSKIENHFVDLTSPARLNNLRLEPARRNISLLSDHPRRLNRRAPNSRLASSRKVDSVSSRPSPAIDDIVSHGSAVFNSHARARSLAPARGNGTQLLPQLPPLNPKPQLGSPAFSTGNFRRTSFIPQPVTLSAQIQPGFYRHGLDAFREEDQAPVNIDPSGHHTPRTTPDLDVVQCEQPTGAFCELPDLSKSVQENKNAGATEGNDAEKDETLEQLLRNVRSQPIEQLSKSDSVRAVQFATSLNFKRSRRSASIRSSSQEIGSVQPTSVVGVVGGPKYYSKRPMTSTGEDVAVDRRASSISRDLFRPGEILESSTTERRQSENEAKLRSKVSEELFKKEKAAAEKISQVAKRGQVLREFNDLFDENPPTDEEAEARIQRSIENDLKRRHIREDAQIIDAHNKKLDEELAANRKRRAADELEAKREARKQKITDDDRRREKEKEEERLQRKKAVALERLEIERRKRQQEEDAVQKLKKMEEEQRAARERAAALKPGRKPSTTTITISDEVGPDQREGDAITVRPSDEGLFVADDDEDVVAVKSLEHPKRCKAITLEQEKDKPAESERDIAQISKPTVKAGNGILFTALASDNRRTARETKPKPRPARLLGREIKRTLASSPDPQVDKAPSKSFKDRLAARKVEALDRKAELLLRKSIGQVEKLKADAEASEERREKQWAEQMVQLQNTIKSQQSLQVENQSVPMSQAVSEPAHNLGARGGRFDARSFVIPEDNQTVIPSQNHTRTGSFGTSADKNSNFSSKITFMSQVEAQEKQKTKDDEEKLKRYEKRKREYRRKTERDHRNAMKSQELVVDEEKIKVAVDKKMLEWEENRRKKEEKAKTTSSIPGFVPKKLGGSTGSLESQQTVTVPTEALQHQPMNSSEEGINSSHGASAPNETNEVVNGTKDPEKEKREEVIRAGVRFLASKNNAGSAFAEASTKSRIEDLESEESEEDPDDDEPERPIKPTTEITDKSPANDESINDDKSTSLPWTKPSGEPIDAGDLDDALFGEELEAALLEDCPPLPRENDLQVLSLNSAEKRPSVSQEHPDESQQSLLTKITNPAEEDMINVYKVKHLSERGKKVFPALVLGVFHDLSEANNYALEKVEEIIKEAPILSELGRSETWSGDGLYQGKVITSKTEANTECIFVVRETCYIGNLANIQRSDIKKIMPPRTFNVLANFIREPGADPEDEIITATTIKALANKKATDHFLALSKPLHPDYDAVKQYKEMVVPVVLEQLKQMDEEDGTVCFEGADSDYPEVGRWFRVKVVESEVVGPRN